MKHSPFLFGLLSLAIAGCEPSELRPVPAFPIGGNSGYSAPARPVKPQPTTKPLVPNRHEMIDDPEAQTEPHQEDIWAEDEISAMEKCRQLAESYTRKYKTRVTLQRVQKLFNKRYRCHLEMEVQS